MKKILFIILTFSGGGGVEKILSNLINNLDEEKYEVSILELSNRGHEYPKLNRNVNIISIDKDDIINKNNIVRKIIRLNPNWYGRYISKKYILQSYDVNIGCNFLEPVEVLGATDGKKLLWIHGGVDGTLIDKNKSVLRNIKNIIREINNYRILKIVDTVIPISKHIQEKLINKYSVDDNKIRLMYNSYDFDEIIEKSKSKQNVFMKEYFNIVMVGRIDINKNQILLIEAAKFLKKEKKNIKINIIGIGEEEEHLKAVVKENKLEEYVEFIGYKENPYPYIKQADIFCLTSLSEGFPTVLVESMILKVPIISTNVSGVEEIGNKKYISIISNDAKELSNKIIEVIDNYNIYKELAEEGNNYIKKFSIDKLISTFNDIVEAVN